MTKIIDINRKKIIAEQLVRIRALLVRINQHMKTIKENK